MPAPTTTGVGLMGYPSTVDTGQVVPAIISNEVGAMVGNNNTTLTQNAVYLFAFEVNSNTTILGGKWWCGSTAASTANMAIYTLAGSIVSGSDSGAVNNSASSVASFTYSTPVTLAPGQYFMAFASATGTDTYIVRSGAGNSTNMRERKATNSLSAGSMPTSTGTLLQQNVAVCCSLTVSGGL